MPLKRRTNKTGASASFAGWWRPSARRSEAQKVSVRFLTPAAISRLPAEERKGSEGDCFVYHDLLLEFAEEIRSFVFFAFLCG